MPHSAFAAILIALAVSVASAGTIPVPVVPESSFADTESVTNAAVRTSLTNAPPSWLFSRDWDAVRVTANGVDATAETVSVRLDNDPWLFIAR